VVKHLIPMLCGDAAAQDWPGQAFAGTHLVAAKCARCPKTLAKNLALSFNSAKMLSRADVLNEVWNLGKQTPLAFR
jgi:hypothetical protein